MDIVCISCEHRHDRRAALLQRFSRLGLQPRFHIVQKDQQNPERGCYRSHVEVARKLQHSGTPSLVLEDDALPSPGVDLAAALSWLRWQDSDLLHLGVRAERASGPRSGLPRVAGTLLHAYLLSPRGARRLARLPDYSGTPIDVAVMQRCGLESDQAWAGAWRCHAAPTELVSQDETSQSDLRSVVGLGPGWRTLTDLWVYELEPATGGLCAGLRGPLAAAFPWAITLALAALLFWGPRAKCRWS